MLEYSCPHCGENHLMCECTRDILRASDRVRAVLDQNPGTNASNAMIAKVAGVSDMTVGRVRNSTPTYVEVGEKRVGLDGKTRSLPARAVSAEDIRSQPGGREAVRQRYATAPEPVRQWLQAYHALPKKQQDAAWQLFIGFAQYNWKRTELNVEA